MASKNDIWQTSNFEYCDTVLRRVVPAPFHSLLSSPIPISGASGDGAAGGGGGSASSSLVTAEGKVVGFKAAKVAETYNSHRAPELFLIAYAEHRNDEQGGEAATRRILYAEEITREELESSVSSTAKRLLTSLPSFQTELDKDSLYSKNVQDRTQEGLHRAAANILHKCTIVAALELETEGRQKAELEALLKKTAASVTDSKKRGKDEIKLPKYYEQHPNSYLGRSFPPLPPPDQSQKATKEDREQLKQQEREQMLKASLSPSQIATRVKTGLALAFEILPPSDNNATNATSLRRSARQRVAIDYNDDVIGDKAESNEKEDLDERVFTKAQQAGGRVALFLLRHFRIISHASDHEPENDEIDAMYIDTSDTITESDFEVKNDMDEEIVNPFYQPTPYAILEYLGRKQRGMSPSDIQAAICRAVEAGLEHEVAENDGCYSNDQVLLSTTLISHQDTENRLGHTKTAVCLICTSGDKLDDLPDFEPASFARCRFATKTFVTNVKSNLAMGNGVKTNEAGIETHFVSLVEEQQQHLLEEQEAESQRMEIEREAQVIQHKEDERTWKAKKQYETWRWKCVVAGGGCTIWPSWSSFVLKNIQKQLEEEKLKQSSEAVGESNGFGLKHLSYNTFGADPILNGPAQSFSRLNEQQRGFSDEVELQKRNKTEEQNSALALAISDSAPYDITTTAITANTDPTHSTIAMTAASRRTRRTAASGIHNAFSGDVTSAANSASTSGIIFYGSNLSLSSQQLVSTINRLIVQSYPHFLTLMDLKRLIIEDYSTKTLTEYTGREFKRLRLALGKLVYKLGKVRRILVSMDGDAVCWRQLCKEGALVTLSAPPTVSVIPTSAGIDAVQSSDVAVPTKKSAAFTAPDLNAITDGFAGASDKGDLALVHDATNATDLAAPTSSSTDKLEGNCDSSASQSIEDEPEAKSMNKIDLPLSTKATPENEEGKQLLDQESTSEYLARQNLELQALQTYIKSLHYTELTLRLLLLQHYEGSAAVRSIQTSPAVLGCAADEREDEVDAMDSAAFKPRTDDSDNSHEEIIWMKTPPHALLGKILYRPALSTATADLLSDQCFWCKVVAYTPSVPLSQNKNDVNNKAGTGSLAAMGKDEEGMTNTIVERRIRFRALKIPSPNLDGKEEHGYEEYDENTAVVLTEGQVYAGISSARLMLEKRVRSTTHASMVDRHPFQSMTGMRILLTPLKADGSEDEGFSYGTIVGHDTVFSKEAATEVLNDVVARRVLVLLDGRDENSVLKKVNGEAGNVDDFLVKREETTMENFGICVFWANLVSDDESVLVPLNSTAMSLAPSYKLAPQEYHASSAAYQACKTVLSAVKAHIKCAPFLDPVDPVELGIPDYFSVVKNPMDISTVEKKLAEGKYGLIPPGGEFTSPEGKMLYGPFRDDMMLIFDNAMLFNPVGDWIYNDAQQLKRLVSKKIETMAVKAERSTGITSRGGSAKKKSVYVDEDSDVDMYEFESDADDDEFRGASRRKRKRGVAFVTKQGSSQKSEDFSTEAIEAPFRVPNNTTSGMFACLPINSDASTFGLPESWSCRQKKDHGTNLEFNDIEHTSHKEKEEQEKLLLLQTELCQQAFGMRRSARSHTATSACNDLNNRQNGGSNSILRSMQDVEYYLCDSSIVEEVISTTANDRIQVESVRETMHENFFASLCYKYASDTSSPITATSVNDAAGEPNHCYGMFTEGSFPPYLGRIVPVGCVPTLNGDCVSLTSKHLIWEIRAPFVLPALRWVTRGLLQSGHLTEVEPTTNLTSDGGIANSGDGVLLLNSAYVHNESMTLYDVLDAKEMQRRKRSEMAESSESEQEEEVEMSAYEKMRAERVARNKERLKSLGLV